MKKILFLCDGENFSNGAFEFVKMIHENEPVFVKGFFFTPIDYEKLIPVSHVPIAEPYVKLKEEEKRALKKSEDRFIKQCTDAGIKYRVHNKNEEWDKEVFARESRFADLAVISEELFCFNIVSEQPNYIMQEALHNAECPVVIVPETFRSLDRLVFAYDGKKESMFALKQFVHLFPECSELPAEFVYANEGETEEIPYSGLLEEYASQHFNSLGASKLNFDPKKYFSTWFMDKKNVMLITGSYSRSGISSLLKQSFTNGVIRDHASPVFIAHHV